MLAKACSEISPNIRSDQTRHLAVMTRFVERARRSIEPNERRLNLILRSAASGPAAALVSLAEDIRKAGITPKIILATLEPREELGQLATLMTGMYGGSSNSGAMRWTKNPKLLDAHEQAILGSSECWTGDAMGRDPSRRNAFSLFSDNSFDMVRLAERGFAAMWQASEPISERRLIAMAGRVREPDDFPSEDGVELNPPMPVFDGFNFFRH